MLRVSSSNQHDTGGCELALIELTPELASLALGRIAALRELKSVDPDLDEMYYWAYFIECYFDPWLSPTSSQKTGETEETRLADVLDQLESHNSGSLGVPAHFQIPSSQVAAVECEQMVVRRDSIAFMAIPKHTSFYVQTAEIPVTMLEAVAASAVHV